MAEPRLAYADDLVQIWHGDYLDGLQLLHDAHADVIITDPPYGDTSLEWDSWPKGWLVDAALIADALWCWGSFRMFHEHAAEFAAWKYSQEIVWEKHNGTGLLNDRFRRVHELAVLWYRGEWRNLYHETPVTLDARKRVVRRAHKPAHLHGATGATEHVREEGGPRLMRSVIEARNEHSRAIHPTQKPQAVLSPLVQYSCPPGGLVVDMFGGSGSTALAARQAGRRCIVFEVRSEFADAAAQRLAQQDFDLGAIS